MRSAEERARAPGTCVGWQATKLRAECITCELRCNTMATQSYRQHIDQCQRDLEAIESGSNKALDPAEKAASISWLRRRIAKLEEAAATEGEHVGCTI